MSSHKWEWWDTDMSLDVFALSNVAHGSDSLPCGDRLVDSPAWFSSTKVSFPQSGPNLYKYMADVWLCICLCWISRSICLPVEAPWDDRPPKHCLVQAFAWFRLLKKTGINWHGQPFRPQEHIYRRELQSISRALEACSYSIALKGYEVT